MFKTFLVKYFLNGSILKIDLCFKILYQFVLQIEME